MEHYRRAEVVEQPLEPAQLPFRHLPDDLVWMKVKATSRVANMVGYVQTQLKTHDHVLWSGRGQAVCKAIQSAELLKKAVGELHQETHCCYHRSTEVWKPKENEALDTLKVNKDIPAIHILLSKTPLNPDSPSYQPPHQTAPFWSAAGAEETTTQTKKPNRTTQEAAGGGDTSLKKRRRRGPPGAR
ncbi:ribonuclease P protein subunit p25-like protein [Amphibalanus amphitrite]|uniref:ribonuclease P protein subunit p25-like protein n=1 Tax=Amphibalanus amphitrite TaxID=1232801 RepID=UPI001C908417|nr:ribonuclease P protein subunit p25-like protein [Amphibalanus amphitrite]XP_043240398.1 ribonuclease P protein subunit p25-like protein [Amphibalanus amphitrite]XP_043240399.1 ribonuclease P protein subunit p25-like protein [Amphibalanus amphitrite]XP_043240401.1 ribonuclease P protein subunit p25-like protein [Amphibalanus amphitrite]XP_043240402.1 ribonuclease P protein subunit p25-like protein [Amphibalanus amphitrite]